MEKRLAKSPPKRTLFFRVTALIWSLLVVSVLASTLINIQSQDRLLRQKLIEHGKAIAETVSHVASGLVADQDIDSLSRMLVMLVHDDRQLVGAFCTDSAGKIIVDSQGGTEGAIIQDLIRPLSEGTVEEAQDPDGLSVLRVTSPLRLSGEPYGAFRAEISLATLQAEIRAAVRIALITGVVLLAMGTLGAAGLARAIARPVVRLATVADEIAQGNLDVRTGIHSSDEIGALARSFDNMAVELAIARDKALEASRLKADFLANMTHELRTPMNAVIALTEMLLETDLDDEQRDSCQIVRSSGNSLLQLINDILDFSKMEAGKMTLERVELNLLDTVEGVIELLGLEASSKGLELMCSVDERLPRAVRGDSVRLRQILFCLVSNAIKFTESGEVLTRATLSEETESIVVVQFEVMDTGIGIAPEAKQLLFQTFTQVDGSRTRKYGGTGIGLSIAKQLTKLFGGDIGVESEWGKGSTFWFRVPLEKSAGEEELPRCAAAELAGIRVLLAIDNARQRSILEKQLGQWGAKTTSTENCLSVLKLLREAAELQQPYSIAILDLHVAGKDGLTLARQISADPAMAQVATLILTADPKLLPSKVVTEAKVAACLKKPFRRSQLHDCLIKLKKDFTPSFLP